MSNYGINKSIYEKQLEMRKNIFDKIEKCPKLTLFVFDELQNANKEIFKTLSDILDSRGYVQVDQEHTKNIYTKNVFYIIFIVYFYFYNRYYKIII